MPDESRLTPDIHRILRNVWTRLCDHVLVCHAPESTAARPAFVPLHPTACVAILKTPACRAAEENLNRLALTGDALATNRAANVWVKAVQAALPTPVPSVPPPCVHMLVKDGTGTYCWRCNERVETFDARHDVPSTPRKRPGKNSV